MERGRSPSPGAIVILTAALCTLRPARAQAQTPAPSNPPALAPASAPAPAPAPASAPASAPAPIPDAIFSALRSHRVILTLRSGSKLEVLLLVTDADPLIAATVPRGEIVSVPKRDVLDVNVLFPPPKRVRVRYAPGLPPRALPPPTQPLLPLRRYFGLHIGIPPSLMADLDYRRLLLFGNVSATLPFLTREAEVGFPFGGFTQAHLWVFTVGAGATFHIAPRTRWQFDLFAIGAGSNWNPNVSLTETYAAFGVGFGFHATLERGFSFGLKAPLLGLATKGSAHGSSLDLVGTFYSASLVGLPLASFGYRF